jgi:hypothetical protein
MGNSKELQFAYQIKRRLNEGAMDLPSGATERLRAAREQALSKQRRAVASSVAAGTPFTFSFAWIGSLAPLAVLVLGLGAIHMWHQSELVSDIADIDIQMLADELPPNAYLDKGFGAWLTQTDQGRRD